MEIGVHTVAMNAPRDIASFEGLIETGPVDPTTIVALIGETEDDGGANDATLGFPTLSNQLMLAKTSDPTLFVLGGTEHQCAPGAAPIAAIVRV